MTPRQWSAAHGLLPAFELLTGAEVAAIRRGIAAEERIIELEKDVMALGRVKEKLAELISMAATSNADKG